MNQKIASAGWLLAVLLTADIFTKNWAEATLGHGFTTLGFGGWVPFTLTYNTGVAFGIRMGDMRWVIIGGTVLVMGALCVLFYQARHDDSLRITSLAAVMAGALGNLIDRVRWDGGVVDFIGPFTLGFANVNFPIFNIADVAITVGALMLAISLWLEERTDLEPATVDATSTEPA